MPLSHLTLTVSHLPTSTSFFLSCLQPLGYQFIGRHEDYIGFGQKQGEPADFWITEQKPGIPAGAAHVAFPAPSRDAVGSFFISALKAGAKIHGEPKLRDQESGYFSAAVIDFDGNSIEAVHRPSSSSSRSEEARGPALSRLENGSVASKAKSVARSRVSDANARPDIPESASYGSKAATVVERSISNNQTTHTAASSSSSSTIYNVYQTHQPASDGSKAAKTIVGTLLGAAAGAAIAYAMVHGDSQSRESTSSPPPQYAPPSVSLPQYSAQDLLRLVAPSLAPASQAEPAAFQAIEAPPARSAAPSKCSQSAASKNPRADTIYEETEYYHHDDDRRSRYTEDIPRRASEGSVYTTRDLPLRAIEYPPHPARTNSYPCNPSTFISSYHDRPQRMMMDKASVYSSSSTSTSTTIKPSKAHRADNSSFSHTSSRQPSHSSRHHHSPPHKSHAGAGAGGSSSSSSTHSTRSARHAALPESCSIASSYRSAAESVRSARHIPLPESLLLDDDGGDAEAEADYGLDTHIITPDDSISQIGDSRRSTHSARRSHHSKSGGGGGSSSSHVSRRSSTTKQLDEPVRPSDSISQVSSNASRASQRTVKACGGSQSQSKTASRVGGSSISSSSRRGSQA